MPLRFMLRWSQFSVFFLPIPPKPVIKWFRVLLCDEKSWKINFFIDWEHDLPLNRIGIKASRKEFYDVSKYER